MGSSLETFLQYGQNTMMFSHSSSHVHRFASSHAHLQHMGPSQHFNCICDLPHVKDGHNDSLQIVHVTSSATSSTTSLLKSILRLTVGPGIHYMRI